jgi:hypothetical protein
MLLLHVYIVKYPHTKNLTFIQHVTSHNGISYLNMASFKCSIRLKNIPRSQTHMEVFSLCMVARPWIRQSPASHRGAQVLSQTSSRWTCSGQICRFYTRFYARTLVACESILLHQCSMRIHSSIADNIQTLSAETVVKLNTILCILCWHTEP